MFGERIREHRRAAGLSQQALAARAGVSRQLVGAVEAGRHLPRVDAAAALAGALGASLEALLRPGAGRVVAAVGDVPPAGDPVRVGRVGDRLVCAPCPSGASSWGMADGLVDHQGVELLPGADPGAVVVGCDPALGIAERLVTAARGPGLMTVSASTAAAIEALGEQRAHVAVVHGRSDSLPTAPAGVGRWRLGTWRVGLATAAAAPGWEIDVLAGDSEVIQREPGAAVQAAFERAVAEAGGTSPPGPRVGGHLEAARAAGERGLAAVTIEPAATAAGLAFHPLETHECQLWVDDRWHGEPGVVALLEVVGSARFRAQVAAVGGGYDLAGSGSPA